MKGLKMIFSNTTKALALAFVAAVLTIATTTEAAAQQKKKAKLLSQSKPAAASATASATAATVAPTTTAAAATQTTATTVSEVKPETAKKWSASFTASLETSNENLNKNIDSEITSAYILKAGYKLSSNLSLFVRPAAIQNLKTRSASKQDVTLGDLVVGASQSLDNVWNIFPKMSMEHRIYLPTSQKSYEKKSGARYLGLYGMPFTITPKLEMSYNFWPMISTSLQGGTGYSITQYGKIGYQLTEKVSVFQDIGFTHSFNSLSNMGIARNDEKLMLATGIAWMPTKNLLGIFQVGEQKDIMNGNYTHGVYQSDESTYELIVSVSI